MSETTQIHLKTSCILNVPFQTYNCDFSFIVNGKEFKTCQIISDLLSPNICKMHINDPTFNQFIINTKHRGDFSRILQLIQFTNITISKNELEFIYEVLEILGNQSINLTRPEETYNLTLDNVIPNLKRHELFQWFYSKEIDQEVNFIASHFYELSEAQKKELFELNELTITKIVSNSNLKLTNEDEILKFINNLYENDTKYENLYENVIFSNVSSSAMIEFIELVQFDDMSFGTWLSLSLRLKEEIKSMQEKPNRYSKSLEIKNDEKIKKFVHNEGKELQGIIHYLTKKTGGNIHDNGTIEVTTNSLNTFHPPKNLVDFSDPQLFYHSENRNQNIWLCFDFKNMEIEVSSYSIKSAPGYKENKGNLKNWVFEVSNDGKNWTIVDQRSNNSDLNGESIIKTYDVKEKKFSRYCRIRHSGEYWGIESYCIHLGRVEFYGRLKEE